MDFSNEFCSVLAAYFGTALSIALPSFFRRSRFRRDAPYDGFFAWQSDLAEVSVRLRYTGPISLPRVGSVRHT